MKSPRLPGARAAHIVLFVLCLTAAAEAAGTGIEKLAHLIFVMQENRSFDHYFGTFPGADGIPMQNGIPTVSCIDPLRGKRLRPFHLNADINTEGPHDSMSFLGQCDGGRMDGFLAVVTAGQLAPEPFDDPEDMSPQNYAQYQDVVGYHDDREIPNYWSYARNYVLQDRMFASSLSWSQPARLFQISAWSAWSPDSNPMHCIPNVSSPNQPWNGEPPYSWTDITWLLHQHHVTWRYYVGANTPSIWNPLPWFLTVLGDSEANCIQPVDSFYAAAANGTLPSICWITPSEEVSEHAPRPVSAGQAYVTGLVNAVMQGPNWDSCAIFVSWDDWGGFYDHVVPPTVDGVGYGIRVPAFMVSPYARAGYIDHQTLSHDAYLKFIEDRFLNGQRIDTTCGRPDSRPNVRESASILGDLTNEFNFDQPRLRPLILNPWPVKPRPPDWRYP
jgi:phospholipase C